MKKKLKGIAAAGLVAIGTLSWIASGAQADNSVPPGRNFILVSNRSLDAARFCLTYGYRNGITGSDCREVKVRNVATWFYDNPGGISSLSIEGNGRKWPITPGQNTCFRVSYSGKFHPATDKTCTSDGSPSTQSPTRSSYSIPDAATGDTRNVTEPAVPSAPCAFVNAGLSMPDRTAPDSQESNPPDTARIQGALDACPQESGTATVELQASGGNNAFLTGPLTIHQGEVLLIDSGVTLFGSRNPADYQVPGEPTCGTVSSDGGGCMPLITVSNAANAGVESVSDSNGSQGRIDGRGDQDILGTNTTWWNLATEAQQTNQVQNVPWLITADHSNNFTLYDLDLLNSPGFHVAYKNGDGFTAWGLRINTPATARNTDGIDPASATNVTIANSYIQDGDDGIAIKAQQPSSNITIENSYFYGTHGISIGGEIGGGVNNVLVENNTLIGTDSSGNVSGSNNGLRIKSSPEYGGLVSTVTYLNTCMSGIQQPLDFETQYSDPSFDRNYHGGGSIPQYTGIMVNGLTTVNSTPNAQSVFNGYDSDNPLGVTLENVTADVSSSTASYANITIANSNIQPSGTGVSVTGQSESTGPGLSCTFPAYPAL